MTASAVAPKPARARSKALRILRSKHFVPGYETYLEKFIDEWGERNDTDVIVDNVGLGDLPKLVAAEAAAGRGHDIVHAAVPPSSFEAQLIDHREIYETCRAEHGAPVELVLRSSVNPRTGKAHCFAESFATTVVTWRKDLWDAVGKRPSSWDDLRRGGRAIKLLHGKPVGISLAAEHNAEHSLRALLYSFGGAVLTEDGRSTLGSPATLEALRFGKALFEEAMAPEVLGWDPPANNRFILSGDGAATIDTLSIIRAAESTGLAIDPELALAPLPEGPAGRIGPNFGLYNFSIWKFAANQDGAKRFLVDYVRGSREALIASGFQNMPAFPGAVRDLAGTLASDPNRPARYGILVEALKAVTNVGHPGYTTAAEDEILRAGVVARMFAAVATGKDSAEDAASRADAEVKVIAERWREAGKP